jgi:hypothetical protein
MQFLWLCAYFWEGTAYYRDFISRSCGRPNRITIDLTFASEDVAAHSRLTLENLAPSPFTCQLTSEPTPVTIFVRSMFPSLAIFE